MNVVAAVCLKRIEQFHRHALRYADVELSQQVRR